MRSRPVQPWACVECGRREAVQMCAHYLPNGEAVSFCSPECLEQYLEGKD